MWYSSRQAGIFAVSAVYPASSPPHLPGLFESSWEHDTSYMGCLLQRPKVALGYMVPTLPTSEGPEDRSLDWKEKLFSVAF